MLMGLGFFVFERRTLPISQCSIRRTTAGCQMTVSETPGLSVSRGGGNLAYPVGHAYPEITGGRLSLMAIELMADEGAHGR